MTIRDIYEWERGVQVTTTGNNRFGEIRGSTFTKDSPEWPRLLAASNSLRQIIFRRLDNLELTRVDYREIGGFTETQWSFTQPERQEQ